VWQRPNGGGKVAELVGEAMGQKKYQNFKQNSLESSLH
jgi:hypothetical protein